MERITVHGLTFDVIAEDWGSHEAARDVAVDHVVTWLGALGADAARELHHILGTEHRVADPAELEAAIASAYRLACRGWHDPNGAGSLYVVAR